MDGICKVYSATSIGIEAFLITIEISISTGIGIFLVGLPDNAVKESLMRITAVLIGYGYKMPGKRIIINMAPANMKKEGSSYDIAIALGILSISGQIDVKMRDDFLILGELSLDGSLRRVPGILPILLRAKSLGFKACIIPDEAKEEGCEIDDITIYCAHDISDVIEILSSPEEAVGFLLSYPKRDHSSDGRVRYPDFSEIKGQEFAKRGMEIAASGGHNIILVGTPGSGKSMIAKALPSILPPISREESLETSMIYSVSGGISRLGGLIKERPFRSPHHSSSPVSLIGGGQNAMPGEISLAHNGVLYLDEIAEYSKYVLDLLRQPMEDREVSISRAKYKIRYPASFMLVASMNPCPCGYWGDESSRCKCTPGSVNRYVSRISGPLMDRIDIQIKVGKIPAGKLLSADQSESSEKIALRVKMARKRQLERFKGTGIYSNSQMESGMIAQFCLLGETEKRFLNDVIDKFSLSGRAYNRILKLSRTIADLSAKDNITLEDISEAVQFRIRLDSV